MIDSLHLFRALEIFVPKFLELPKKTIVYRSHLFIDINRKIFLGTIMLHFLRFCYNYQLNILRKYFFLQNSGLLEKVIHGLKKLGLLNIEQIFSSFSKSNSVSVQKIMAVFVPILSYVNVFCIHQKYIQY